MTSFNKLRTEHFPIIHEWFNQPHVQQFYSLRSWTKEEVVKKLEPYISGGTTVYPYIVTIESRPVAYVQYYPVALHSWPNQDLDDDVVQTASGLDLFIGEEEFVGQGWGPKIVNVFLNEIVWKDFQYCVVDPDMKNESSIRAFQKSGFRKHKVIQSDSALGDKVELQLMIKNRDEDTI